ncbi:MAG TPA: hypothetical protein V6C76_11765 [Drouetiella sp.]
MSDQFKVGIILELQDRFSAGLRSVSAMLTSTQSHLSGINASIGKMRQLQSTYSNIASVGKSIANTGISALQATIDPAKEYVHQLNLMNMNGLKHLDIQKNIQASWKTAAAVPTSTPAGNLAALSDLRTIFVGKNAAQEGRDLLPTFQRIQATLDASQHKLGGHTSHDIVFSAAKAVEMMGVLDPEKFKHHLSEMTRVAS